MKLMLLGPSPKYLLASAACVKFVLFCFASCLEEEGAK